MPKRYRSGKAKATTRKSRYMARRFARRGITRSLPGSKLGVYHFKRTARLPQLVFTAGSTLVYGQEFSIADIPNLVDFSTLFDVIRINAIKITWVPTATSADANPNSTQIFMPNICSVIDYTDSSAPANLNELMQYASFKRSKLTSGHSRYFKPRMAMDAVGQLGATGYVSRRADYHSFGVPLAHYGVKWMLDQIFNVASGGIGVDRYVTFYFSCKTVR